MEGAPVDRDGQYLYNALSVVVLGASGDLAKKKTYPALFDLYTAGFLSPYTTIWGYARSQSADAAFRGHIKPYLMGKKTDAEFEQQVDRFLEICFYRAGSYNSNEDFSVLSREISTVEATSNAPQPSANRVFYFALPPVVFVPCAAAIKAGALSANGWNRLIVEKPFGHSLQSALALASDLGRLYTEDYIYRIDHYLGKEMVQNLIILRFGNNFMEPLWNRNYIDSVQIVFKEDFGTDGRGGYFDTSGIIRDIMQNHLMQVLTLIAMEPPVTVSGPEASNHLRDAKVKVIQCMPPLTKEDVLVGQYVAAGGKPGYRDDSTVPPDSITPTFCVAKLKVNSPRWCGVPFIMKAGKALDERKVEIRLQFKSAPAACMMFDGQEIARNELVIRLQPNEAIYMKTNIKGPGLVTTPVQSELDLSYQTRYAGTYNPDAYTRLLLDVLRGKQGTFVRTDEVLESWRVFDPLLASLEADRVVPLPYPYGSRGPPEADAMIQDLGYVRNEAYTWNPVR